VKDEASYVCDSCGEEIVLPIDLYVGAAQEYIQASRPSSRLPTILVSLGCPCDGPSLQMCRIRIRRVRSWRNAAAVRRAAEHLARRRALNEPSPSFWSQVAAVESVKGMLLGRWSTLLLISGTIFADCSDVSGKRRRLGIATKKIPPSG